ncbi:TadE/TadG family type IV pilus assembly protein [Planctomycetes bacterium K23_9]|uniref:TadE-like protein n=1 Tax=Stieleria marina TaxID=1930275 RepID=A0A517P1S7_9BACT|nr:TadE-like protein [Planctomycetes bacterium K23_9]
MKLHVKNFRQNRPVKRLGAKNRQGAAMVEFAIVAPILFLFFFAAFEFCRVNMIRHTADNAVYEGARVAIIPGATAAEAEAEARLILNSLGLNNVTVTVTPNTIDRTTEEVTVSAEIPLDQNSFIPHVFTSGRSVDRELTMRREGVRRDNTAS